MKGRLKKWGNSLGVVIPADVVNSEGLKEGDEVEVEVHKYRTDIQQLFGIMLGVRMDAQAMKDETRRTDMERDERLAKAGQKHRK